jgi:hypothetical protein
MPPTDNTSSPTPGNPKKGFFAKLAENFFKKSPEKTTVAAPDISKHESQTPAPVLDDASDRSAPAGAPATDAAAPAAGTGVHLKCQLLLQRSERTRIRTRLTHLRVSRQSR